ncbi:uncharacterized protein [Arachis hypogaea]|uniref:uncharacterized protein n=1 Tax=Arachis hypogaea TaxID=3818 RepID=UPI000DED2EB9|nr:uncharacterized protein LOC112749259 [Arachis hypogaea]
MGRNIRFYKNDKVRVRAVCKCEDCPWIVYCRHDPSDGSWQIKTLVDNHTCARKRKNRAATLEWIVNKLYPKLRKHPKMKHREVYEWFVRKCNVKLNSSCITRALKASRKIVERDEIAQYGLIWDYAHELLTANPGSTVQVGVIPITDNPPQFEIFYVCLDAYKKGFKDANNHIFVIAYAIVDVENKENWKWFLELLLSDLGEYETKNLCFISDMQKGLIPAVKELVPTVLHRFCVWHLWRNFSKQ